MTDGSRPAGTTDEESSTRAVQQMFDQIAPRYDVLNRVLSANIAALWWARTARRFAPVLARADSHVVDLCCGTGSMTLALQRYRPADAVPILAMDFSHAMLALGARKFAAAAFAVETDAMQLPLPGNSIDLITTAFGFRNLPNYDAALREMHRVLRPGGTFAILEANEPQGALSGLYRWYFHRAVPWIGSLLSSPSAYRYLPESVGRFPQPAELLPRIRSAGFSDATWTAYTLGAAGLYCCTK